VKDIEDRVGKAAKTRVWKRRRWKKRCCLPYWNSWTHRQQCIHCDVHNGPCMHWQSISICCFLVTCLPRTTNVNWLLSIY